MIDDNNTDGLYGFYHMPPICAMMYSFGLSFMPCQKEREQKK